MPATNRWEYYEGLKALARQIRAEFNLASPKVGKADLRRIYKAYGIRIDRLSLARNILGAYFNDENGVCVLLNKNLPTEPTISTMGHELKHHLVDKVSTVGHCKDGENNDHVEIGAGIFAAELVFPEPDFIAWFEQKKISKSQCTPKDIVRLKHETQTTLSYKSLKKRAIFLKFALEENFAGVKWTVLAELLYGKPIYKQLNRFNKKRKLSVGAVPF